MTGNLLFDFPIESKSEYKYINNSTELEAQLSSYLTADEIGLDIETTGLDPYQNRIRLLQLSSTDAPNLLIDAYATNNWIVLLEALLEYIASVPTAVFSEPVVFACRELVPTATLLPAVVFCANA